MAIQNVNSTLGNSTVVIANGQQVSTAIDILGSSLVAIITPAALTGTAITLQGSVDGTNYFDIYNAAGSLVSLTVAASRYVALTPSDFASIRYLKLKSGSAEGAERTIIVVVRPV